MTHKCVLHRKCEPRDRQDLGEYVILFHMFKNSSKNLMNSFTINLLLFLHTSFLKLVISEDLLFCKNAYHVNVLLSMKRTLVSDNFHLLIQLLILYVFGKLFLNSVHLPVARFAM